MQLDLVIPGLFDRLRDWAQCYATLPAFPVLEQVLSIATNRRGLANGFEPAIWQQYDSSWRTSDELPSAGILSGIDTNSVFHASPVHLEPGMRDLILTAPEPLTQTESIQLHQHIDEHLQPAGIRHHLDDNGNGYLVFNRRLNITTTPLSQVTGTGVFDKMPGGDDAGQLHKLGNELQMLLHTTAFNRQREREGKLTANALWLWGGGESGRSLRPQHDLLIANHAFAVRCAQISGQQHAKLTERFDRRLIKGHQRTLVVLDALMAPTEHDDIHAWQEAVSAIEQRWIAPLYEALRSGVFDRINIIPCAGNVFSLSRRSHWKRWRRSQPLAQIALRMAK